jgi:hypothetical protein
MYYNGYRGTVPYPCSCPSNAQVQLQARYKHSDEVASEKCLSAATFVRRRCRNVSPGFRQASIRLELRCGLPTRSLLRRNRADDEHSAPSSSKGRLGLCNRSSNERFDLRPRQHTGRFQVNEASLLTGA